MDNNNLNKCDPLLIFHDWYLQFQKHIKENKLSLDHSSMILSTCNKQSLQPSSRTVLLKKYNEDGFVFFTNLNSRKCSDIQSNNKASILFFWPTQQKQIRIEGIIDNISKIDSDNYYATRSKEKKISAWASKQSQILKNTQEFEKRINYYTELYNNDDNIPRPDHWGGLILKANYYEFWEEKLHRRHIRQIFIKDTADKNGWIEKQLYP